MSSFHRFVKDVVADTVTTDQLTANHALIRHELTVTDINATTVNATTVNATAVNLPSPEIFILDDGQVFGVDSGATWSFTRVGNVVTAQLDFFDLGMVVNSNFFQFAIPAPYSPTNSEPIVEPIAMCINAGGTFFGMASIVSGVIVISPNLGGIFIAGDDVQLFGATFTYILV